MDEEDLWRRGYTDARKEPANADVGPCSPEGGGVRLGNRKVELHRALARKAELQAPRRSGDSTPAGTQSVT